ncbi:cilia- and flagella-associated protein 337-like [Discoglossus pictus]
MPDNSLLLIGQDGLISTWTQDLKLKKSRLILDENKNQIRKMKWISDSTLMYRYNKLVIATSDREIRLYETNNFEPYCQIIGLETMPLHIGFSQRKKDGGLLYFGDEQGCVNIIVAYDMLEALRKWSKFPSVDETPTISIKDLIDPGCVQFIRWKVHNDWVTQIKYIPSLNSIISCSNDDYTALVVGCVEETKNVQKHLKDIFESSSMKSKRSTLTGNVSARRNIWDETLYRVRRGVKTFDYCKETHLIVTGGLDRIVRLWNPYVPGWAIGVLHGHSSPIVYVQIADENTRIYSISENCNVMVWDIENQSCLIRVIAQAIPIRGELASCFFSPHQKTLFIAADTLVALQVQQTATQPRHLFTSHSEPVTSCQYNWRYHQVVSCSEGSVIKTWDIYTGKLIFELKAAHESAAISCLSFDETYTRMLTGGRDGSLNKWLYNGTTIKLTKTVIKDDLIINKVIFICSRIEQKKESATLIASGPRGQITFWNIFGGGKVFGSFPGSHYNSGVSDMNISEDDSLLCATDQMFFVYIWKISTYALHGPEEKPPSLLSCWRAHQCDITRVIPVSTHRLVITSSLDCTVRLWSLMGNHIGTFGQNQEWNITKPETWKQQDSAISTTTEISQSKSGADPSPSSVKNMGITAEPTSISEPIDDKDIGEELKKIQILKTKPRVRLVGPKQMEIQQVCGRLNAYKSLQISDLIKTPSNIRKPNPAAELNDPFDLSF